MGLSQKQMRFFRINIRKKMLTKSWLYEFHQGFWTGLVSSLCLADAQLITASDSCSSLSLCAPGKPAGSSNAAIRMSFIVMNTQNKDFNKNFKFLKCLKWYHIKDINILTSLLWNWSIKTVSPTIAVTYGSWILDTRYPPPSPNQMLPNGVVASPCVCPTCLRVQTPRASEAEHALLAEIP